ncbi:hypothetical protein ruthe_02362 [Rubellimicrobium thermophilum DSM 16684]|uniref:Flagellar protein n=2 Tax=Rubellimicrobium TaxID=295418 RepID=S9QX63_9RHOB|nr:DUF1217 domain-containing protein [Rubellimicrobium thermophilum]EPX84152.1 hypothetical protein ruthe_02362 [Rubellimicrobium thermophilum DSM 16684]
MTFQAIVPLSGHAGWRYLTRSTEVQMARLRESPEVKRLTDHFRAHVAKAQTAADLVSDRRLLEVALGAFGLKADLNARAFVQKVLEGGTLRPDSLANRLADKRYAALALEFGYGDLGARTGLPGFAERIIARYERQVFQEAVGERDGAMRLALNLAPALADLAERTGNANAQWYSVIASAPLREVFQTAFGFPASFATIDLDRQLAGYKARAAAMGAKAPTDFADPALQDRLLRLYFLRSGAQQAATSPVLALLRQGG